MKKHTFAKWKLLAAVCAALIVLCLQPARAFALELRMRNDFDKKMQTVVVYFDSQAQKWRTRGWYAVEPRSERKITLSTSKTNIYIYAHLDGMSASWGNGDLTRTVTREAFSYFDGEKCPPGNNRRSVKFTKYEAKNNVVEFRPRGAVADTPMRDAGGRPSQTPRPAPSNNNTANDLRARADELLKLINAERGKAGAPAVRMDETMRRAAERRANELITKYSHYRPDGRAYHTVFAEFNIAPRTSAENIAWREGGANNTSMAAFNKAFMDSPGYRSNMLNRDYSIVGLGVARAGNKYFVAELFAGDSTTSAAQDKSLSESWKELEQSIRDIRDILR